MCLAKLKCLLYTQIVVQNTDIITKKQKTKISRQFI